MNTKVESECQFAILYKKFIDDLLKETAGTDNKDFKNLLQKKRELADLNLLVAFRMKEKEEKQIKEREQQCALFLRISLLPDDLKRLIGTYSPHVRNQKSLVRIEFYNEWFKSNKTHIIILLKGWSKKKLGFVLNHIQSPNNPYYNCCKQGTPHYNKGSALIFKARIELLIEEKGRRSNMEQYSLLLAIEKYDKRK